MRFRLSPVINSWCNKYTLAAGMWGLILGFLGTAYLCTNNTSPQPLETKVEVKAIEITKDEDYYKAEPLRYLRYKGQQLGINEYEITRIISTMKCESGLRPDAINKNKNGTFDIGIGQINDVHSKRISRQDRMDFVKNIDFIYKLYQEQGLRPWVCARRLGFIK